MLLSEALTRNHWRAILFAPGKPHWTKSGAYYKLYTSRKVVSRSIIRGYASEQTRLIRRKKAYARVIISRVKKIECRIKWSVKLSKNLVKEYIIRGFIFKDVIISKWEKQSFQSISSAILSLLPRCITKYNRLNSQLSHVRPRKYPG